MLTPVMLASLIVAASIASAFAALVLMSLFEKPARQRAGRDQPLVADAEPTVFLFEDRELVDATPPAKALLDAVAGSGTEWERLVAFITPKIPDFTALIATLAETQTIEIKARFDPRIRLHAEYIGGLARLTLTDLSIEGQGVVIDGLSLHAQEDELASLREILGKLPMPVWRHGADATVLWANESYLALARDVTGEEDLVWPLPVLFDSGAAVAAAGAPRRRKLKTAVSGRDQWYDCHALFSGDGTLQFAMPADGIVRAENALREFIQTLTKTFAHLPIGLAIFDRQRQLALFNPALIDLTSLGAEFLSARPTLFSFLDHLREARIVPEPKDYASWRLSMTDLEKAASSGLYEETWSLPTGQTYKVTGRPHPDGALALLIEDISAEISLTRRFRAEIELGQNVIDALDDAVVVFSSSGQLVMSNTAYQTLWDCDPSSTLGTISVIDATRIWQTKTRPTPVWGDLRDFAGETAERAEWDADVFFSDGTALACRFVPMPGGVTLVRFAKAATDRPHVRRQRRSRQILPEVDTPAYLDA